MKTLLAAAALFAATTITAHAGSKPTLPTKFHGTWCQDEQRSDEMQMVAARCRPGDFNSDLTIKPNEYSDVDEDCTLRSVRPMPSGKYWAVDAKFKCTGDHGKTIRIYQIGLYGRAGLGGEQTDVLFFMWDPATVHGARK